jgi:hypothetical protein
LLGCAYTMLLNLFCYRGIFFIPSVVRDSNKILSTKTNNQLRK